MWMALAKRCYVPRILSIETDPCVRRLRRSLACPSRLLHFALSFLTVDRKCSFTPTFKISLSTITRSSLHLAWCSLASRLAADSSWCDGVPLLPIALRRPVQLLIVLVLRPRIPRDIKRSPNERCL